VAKITNDWILVAIRVTIRIGNFFIGCLHTADYIKSVLLARWQYPALLVSTDFSKRGRGQGHVTFKFLVVKC